MMLARRAVVRFSTRYSRKRFTLRQHVVLLCLKVRKTTTYRDHDIRPLIKHREFTSLHKAWNARLDGDLYYRRNMNETVNAVIKQKFGAFVRSRRWWKQFRELVIKCVVHNVERSLTIPPEECEKWTHNILHACEQSQQTLECPVCNSSYEVTLVKKE